MLLAIDIGNTNTVLGVFAGTELLFEARLKSEQGRTIDELELYVSALLERRLRPGAQITSAIIASVVPPLTADYRQLVEERLRVRCLIVGPGVKTGVPVRLSEPSQVGADRIVNAVAVRQLYGAPAIVVDFGTATTLDYVAADGGYEGGVIMPGVTASLESLVRNTAKLPRIDLAWPASVIGKGTVHAMQVGTVVGYVAAVEGLLTRMQAEVGTVSHVVATGGLGSLLSKHTQAIHRYDPYLTLHGMRIIADLQGPHS